MNDLSDELDALKLTGIQRFWLMFTIVVLILANSNPTVSKYYKYVGVNTPANVIDLYVATIFTEGDSMTIGILDRMIRVK